MSSQSENQTPLDILAASILIYRYYSIDTFDHLLLRYIFFRRMAMSKKKHSLTKLVPGKGEGLTGRTS